MMRAPARYWFRVFWDWWRPKIETPPPGPKPIEPPDDTLSDQFDLTLVDLFNSARSGSRRLVYDSALDDAADLHSQRQAVADRIHHGNLYDAAENVAQTWSFDADEVFRMWMRSPGHRAHIVNPRHRRVGFGVAKSRSGRVYWTANFGR